MVLQFLYAEGNVPIFFGFQWIFAILEPSGKGLPLPGTERKTPISFS
jgi:hypothetical protein